MRMQWYAATGVDSCRGRSSSQASRLAGRLRCMSTDDDHAAAAAVCCCCFTPLLQLGVSATYKELAPGLTVGFSGTVPDVDSGAAPALAPARPP